MNTITQALGRKLGYVDHDRRNIRFRRLELSLGPALGFGYSVYHSDSHLWLSFLFGTIFVKVPMLITQRRGTEDWNASYGWDLYRDSIHLNWRTWNKVICLPWDYEWLSTEILSLDTQTVVHRKAKRTRRERRALRAMTAAQSAADFSSRSKREKEIIATVSATYPYRYTLRSGEVQDRLATVHVSRMGWGLRCWPFVVKVRTYLDVRFSDEVGEETGSWKGGCVGCGTVMRPGETPEQALRRMERDRKF